jgi:hypothetical protein
MFEDTIGGSYTNGGNPDTSETIENTDGTGENYQEVLNAASDFKANALTYINDKNQ